MTELTKVIIISCATVLMATVLFSGIYTVAAIPSGGVYVVNKFAGGVTFCSAASCRESRPPPPPPPLSSYFEKGASTVATRGGGAAPAPASVPPISFNMAGARAAGVSEAEIADFLAEKANYDIAAARRAGGSDVAIIDLLINGKQ